MEPKFKTNTPTDSDGRCLRSRVLEKKGESRVSHRVLLAECIPRYIGYVLRASNNSNWNPGSILGNVGESRDRKAKLGATKPDKWTNLEARCAFSWSHLAVSNGPFKVINEDSMGKPCFLGHAKTRDISSQFTDLIGQRMIRGRTDIFKELIINFPRQSLRGLFERWQFCLRWSFRNASVCNDA